MFGFSAPAYSPHYEATVLLRLRMDDPALPDTSQYVRAITVGGAVAQSTSVVRAGVGSAGGFTADNLDYIRTPASTDFNVGAPGADLRFRQSAYFTASGGDCTVLDVGFSGGNRLTLYKASGDVLFLAAFVSSATTIAAAGPALALSTWYDFDVTIVGGVVNVYVNGSPTPAITASGALPNGSSSVTYGNSSLLSSGGLTESLRGYVDEVFVTTPAAL